MWLEKKSWLKHYKCEPSNCLGGLMDIVVILAAWHFTLKRCVRFPHAYMAIFPSRLWNWEDKFFTIQGDLLFNWRVSMKIRNMPSTGKDNLDFWEKVFLLSCFVPAAFVLQCCQLSSWGRKPLKWEDQNIPSPFLVEWLFKKCQCLRENIFLMKFPSKDFKILAEKKKKIGSLLSLGHAGMSLASGKLQLVYIRDPDWTSLSKYRHHELKNISQAFPSSQSVRCWWSSSTTDILGLYGFPVARKALLTPPCISCLLYT